MESLLRTIPINRQSPRFFAGTIPFFRMHEASLVQTFPIHNVGQSLKWTVPIITNTFYKIKTPKTSLLRQSQSGHKIYI